MCWPGRIVQKILIVGGLLLGANSHASIDLGVGLNSVTSGRMVPTLAGGLSVGNWLVTGSSTGVRSAYYYHSAYTLNLYWTWKSGNLFWGEVESGLGGGVMYAERAFEDEGSTSELKKSDFAAGPAFTVKWFFAGPIYLNFEMIYGLREVFQNLTLNSQDVIVFSVGAQAW